MKEQFTRGSRNIDLFFSPDLFELMFGTKWLVLTCETTKCLWVCYISFFIKANHQMTGKENTSFIDVLDLR